MISQRFPPHRLAGGELQALALSQQLQALGQHVRVLTTAFAAGMPSTERVDGIEVDRVGLPAGPLLKLSQFVSTYRYVLRHGHSFHIVHAHCLSASSLGAILAASKLGLHTLLQPTLGGDDGELSKLLRSPVWPLALAVIRRADRIGMLQPEIRSEFIAVGVPPDRLVPLDNGIDLGRFHPAKMQQRLQLREQLNLPQGPLAVFVGQLLPRKGLVELLEAWRSVKRQFGTAHLVIAGSGELESRVRRAALDTASGMLFLGDRQDVEILFRCADVAVLPSRNESFGCTFVEAMASGTPVILGNTGVAALLPIHEAAGWVLDRVRPDEIACRIIDMFSDPGRRRVFAERAPDLVQRYRFERVARQYLSLYEEMLNHD